MGVSDKKIHEAATRLREAMSSGVPCDPLLDLLEAGNVADAYQVQQINTKEALSAGRRLVGRKIGLTAKAVQTQLGVDQPDYGMLFADMDVCDGEDIAPGRVSQPRVEAEVAFVMCQNLDGDQLTIADVISSIAFALPAIEVVGSRVRDWKISIVDTIADNASAGLFILGQQPRKLSKINLRLCGMKMEKRGELVSNGTGAACLGSPLNATLWLAKAMVLAGNPLRTGDVVLSGALGPMVLASPGDVFEATISGLGSVRAAFSGEA